MIEKENKIFLIYKEIQKGTVVKSIILLTASSYMTKYFRISSYIREPFLIYDCANGSHLNFLHMRKIFFSFLSVHEKRFVSQAVGCCCSRKECWKSEQFNCFYVVSLAVFVSGFTDPDLGLGPGFW
jgi:hypothetical protein